jgi:hypothetical protein
MGITAEHPFHFGDLAESSVTREFPGLLPASPKYAKGQAEKATQRRWETMDAHGELALSGPEQKPAGS